MKEQTLEAYLHRHIRNQIIDFSVRAQFESGTVSFYIHPANVDGQTVDFFVEGNRLFYRRATGEAPQIATDDEPPYV